MFSINVMNPDVLIFPSFLQNVTIIFKTKSFAKERQLRCKEAIQFLAVQPTRVIYNFTGFCPFIMIIKNLKKLRQED